MMLRGGPNSTAACTPGGPPESPLYGRWIAVAQASQLPQVVPQDVPRPFASLGLPQVVPQVQAQALAGRCAAAAAPSRRWLRDAD